MPKGVYKRKTGQFSNHWKGGMPRCVDCQKTLSDYSRGVSKRCYHCCQKSGLLGHNPGGYKLSDTTRKKMSNRMMGNKRTLGLKHSLDTRKLMSQSQKARFPDSVIEVKRPRMTFAYKMWRESVLERDKYVCRICGSAELLQVHHIFPFRAFPALRSSPGNGITLCAKCHSKTLCKEEEFIPALKTLVWDSQLRPIQTHVN